MLSATFSQQSFRLIFVAGSLSILGCGSVSDRVVEEEVEQSYQIEPTASIRIKNVDGSIYVYGSPAHELRVEGIKRAYSTNRLKQIAVNVSVAPGSGTIETTFPKRSTLGLLDRSGKVDYTIVVPDTASISQMELANGEVSVEEMRGHSVHARLGRGRMFDHNCFSNVDMAVGRGTLTLAYEWWEPGKFSIQANIANGNAWAFFPSDAAFHLIIETIHGKVASDFAAAGERGTGPTTRMDMSVNGGGEVGIKMHATEGNIKVAEQVP